jgi:5-(aminomethyl)-3-furanmethanol phosphate kinase
MSREPAIVRVIKVGGSLLDWPQLPTALRSWLAAQQPALNILLCGCGPFGDIIRQADLRFSLGQEHSHWLCINALSLTARLLAAIIPEAPHCDRYAQLTARIAAHEPGNIIFDPREFLTDHEAALPGRALSHTWSVTTDSIAARLAQVLEADELILLKSANAPHAASLGDLAASGFVDSHFPLATSSLRSVRLVNLREAD